MRDTEQDKTREHCKKWDIEREVTKKPIGNQVGNGQGMFIEDPVKQYTGKSTKEKAVTDNRVRGTTPTRTQNQGQVDQQRDKREKQCPQGNLTRRRQEHMGDDEKPRSDEPGNKDHQDQQLSDEVQGEKTRQGAPQEQASQKSDIGTARVHDSSILPTGKGDADVDNMTVAAGTRSIGSTALEESSMASGRRARDNIVG